MFFAVVYLGAGIYFLLMSFRLIHRKLVKTWSKSRILALRIMGIGFLVLGGYYAWFHYFMTTPEGKAIQNLQREFQRQLIEQYYQQQRER